MTRTPQPKLVAGFSAVGCCGGGGVAATVPTQTYPTTDTQQTRRHHTAYWIIALGPFLICTTPALIAWRSYRRDADARLVDIAVRPGLWLRRVERQGTGYAHDTVYRALNDASAEELEAHKELCWLLSKCLDTPRIRQLAKTDDPDKGKFWADMHSTKRSTAEPVRINHAPHHT